MSETHSNLLDEASILTMVAREEPLSQEEAKLVSRSTIALIPEDAILIPVVGYTGAGKSTFIEALGQQQVRVLDEEAHQTDSRTNNVYAWCISQGHKIWILDTPGMGDTRGILDQDIQNIILMALKESKQRNLRAIIWCIAEETRKQDYLVSLSHCLLLITLSVAHILPVSPSI